MATKSPSNTIVTDYGIQFPWLENAALSPISFVSLCFIFSGKYPLGHFICQSDRPPVHVVVCPYALYKSMDKRMKGEIEPLRYLIDIAK